MSLATLETRERSSCLASNVSGRRCGGTRSCQGLAWSFLAAALGLAALAAADYLLELPGSTRAAGLAAAGGRDRSRSC